MARLQWKVGEFGEETASDSPYFYEAFGSKNGGEIRIIRRDNLGGVIAPIHDFMVYTSVCNPLL
jgi:hypothetical protein